MTKIAYFQCPTGIAGDMCLGALVHAGVPLDYLTEQLKRLGIDSEYKLRIETVHRQGQVATKVHVNVHLETYPEIHSETHHHPRHLPDIEHLIIQARLPQRVEVWSLAVFRKLAQAEATVHGIPPEQVHFHEVGATDAIVDVVGTCLGLDWLGIDQVYCSALPTGGGTVRAAHGLLPVPVPAVLTLWAMKQVPIYSNGIEQELVTPTGAAIVTTLATKFGQPPAMTVQTIGLGAGSRDLPLPNILRLWIGEEPLSSQMLSQDNRSKSRLPGSKSQLQTVAILETQIDDLSPQAIAYTFDRLFAVGALDVFTQAITMKKSRLGILFTVICGPEQQSVCEAILFQETTTLGIRSALQQRRILNREIQTVETAYGLARVKVAFQDNRVVNVQPEYEDCAALAQEHNVSWLEVHRVINQAWHSQVQV